MKQRWCKINKDVTSFNGSYEQATRHCQSGSNQDDIMEMAYELFFKKHGHNFTLELAWKLQKQSKWRSFAVTGRGSKRTNTSASEVYSTSSNAEMTTDKDIVVESPVRPQGTKAAKRKNKENQKRPLLHFSIRRWNLSNLLPQGNYL
ncbi:hypothetical protein CDL15_Pgr008983 [Punica granatum]|uniref:No apical meristem-associated C-terminal domain-containing protein n=1 Tax=Punica granatum TaxID=22663 RepID=A0A218VYK6_PUNGR|nr:hypothetical protein CDL15_Pgr008983 [Punica granatum]